MKISMAYFALIGLSSAHVAIVGRAPQGPPYKETPPSKQIADAAKDGIKDWGPAGSLKPPEGGPKGPIKNAPGSVPKTPSPDSKSESHRLNKDGGNLKGNIKKPNNSWSKNRLCRKNNGVCVYKSRHVRLTTGGRARAAGAIGLQVLAPYAREALKEMKKWPVVGEIVSGIDDTLTAIQEKIGGKQVPEIYGNELKLTFICWVRGKQQWPNDVDRACDRQREEAERKQTPKGSHEKKWLNGLDRLLDVCSKLETEYPEDKQLRVKLETGCAALEEESDAMENCKCATWKLPKEDNACYTTCRYSLVLEYPKCEALRTNPHHREEYQIDAAKQICPADFCDTIKKYPKLDDKERKKQLELHCAQPTTASTSTSTPPEAEAEAASNQCMSSDGPIPCGGRQRPEELDMGRQVCRSCGDVWDEEGGKCTNRQRDVIWPGHPLANNTVRPACSDWAGWTEGVTCGGGQTQAELNKGYAFCGACGFEWEMEAGGCRNEQGERIWPQKVDKKQKKPLDSSETSEATPEAPRPCGPPDDPNRCRGEQTLDDEFYTGFKLCEVCDFTWDQKSGKCTNKDGYIKWPRQASAGGGSPPRCGEGLSCGGGQTQAELSKGYDTCTACGFQWEVAVGGCSNDQGKIVWPHDGQ